MKFKLMIAAALLVSSSYASATALLVDTGWQDDLLSTAGGPTDLSAWTFSILAPATLSVTDCCATGDTFTLTGDIVGLTTLYAGAADIRSTGSYGTSWLSPTLGHFSTLLGAGTYTFNLIGDGAGGIPASVGLRLDSNLTAAVPEPATWAMMLLGFGFVGGALRSAKRRQRLTVSYG